MMIAMMMTMMKLRCRSSSEAVGIGRCRHRCRMFLLPFFAAKLMMPLAVGGCCKLSTYSLLKLYLRFEALF